LPAEGPKRAAQCVAPFATQQTAFGPHPYPTIPTSGFSVQVIRHTHLWKTEIAQILGKQDNREGHGLSRANKEEERETGFSR